MAVAIGLLLYPAAALAATLEEQAAMEQYEEALPEPPMVFYKAPAMADRIGPSFAAMLLMPIADENDPPLGFVLRGGIRHSLGERLASDATAQTMAVLLGIENRQGSWWNLSTQVRFELLGTRSKSLIPFLYGYTFGSAGLLTTPEGTGYVARVGVGGGWNLIALDHQFVGCLAGTPDDPAFFLIALTLLMGSVELYVERIEAGSVSQQGLRLGIGFAL